MDRREAEAPALLLLDNPTEGVDVGSKAELYGLIRGFAERGAAVLIASAEFGERIKLCDRIYCIADDTLDACLDRSDFCEERLLLEVNRSWPRPCRPRPPPRRRPDWGGLAARYGTVVAALVIFAAFALASDRFLTVNDISNVLIQASVLTIVSSGLTVAVASGEFDLSVGQVASLSGVLVAGLMIWTGLPVALAIPVAIGASAAIGVVNGLLVTRLRIPSLIATLAMGPIALGLNYASTGGDSIYASMPRGFHLIATGKVGGIVPCAAASC